MDSEITDINNPDETFLVDNNNDVDTEKSGFLAEPSLETMPVEIFLEICGHLEVNFVIHTMRKVCKRFKSILMDESLWKTRLNKRLQNKKYPPIDCPTEDFKYDEECVYVERLHSLWRNEETTTKHVVLRNGHFAGVDSILLVNQGSVCISGGRDRSLVVWNVKETIQGQGEVPKPSIKASAHDGWVWALATPSPSSSKVFSASWDSHVKVWDLNAELKETNSFKCPLSVLCLTCIDENVAVAGLFSPDLVVLDTRAGNTPVANHTVHNQSILDIANPDPNSQILYTVSEDHHLAAFDMRAGLLRQKRHLNHIAPNQPFALSLAANNDFCRHALYAGDTQGNIHFFDMRTLDKLSMTSLWPAGKGCKVNSLALTRAGIFACSEGGNICIMNTSLPLTQVATINSTTSSLTRLDYKNDVLAVGTCDAVVEVWVPLDSHLFE